jgi:hypothetical protein
VDPISIILRYFFIPVRSLPETGGLPEEVVHVVGVGIDDDVADTLLLDLSQNVPGADFINLLHP